MADDPKNDPPKDPPKDPKDPPKGDPPGGDPPKDPPKDDDGLEALVKAEVAKVLGENRQQPMPRQSLESLAEQKVKDAVKVLRLEEENQKLKADLEAGKPPEGEPKKEPEVIPKKVRRLTKALWGNPNE